MVVDLNLYIANKSFVINWFYANGENIKNTIPMMATATFVPCIVIAYWIGEETNWHPDAISSIKSLVSFYGYTEIRNKPTGSPV